MESEAIARSFGAWLGGFVITLVAGYLPLRFARSPGRRPDAAFALRMLSVLVAMLFAYGAYLGSGGRINPGNVLAVLVVATWALFGMDGPRST